MKIFGRDLGEYRGQFKELYKYIWYLLKCVFLFKHPLQVISAYIKQQSPPNNLVELRDGMKILLSNHPHDIITVFVIFVREDYGKVPEASTIVDVGANIGIFSLYAARCKARKVYAFEPNSESYQLIHKNIQINNLQNTVVPFQLAVYKNDGEKVAFPVSGSVYNAILEDTENQSHEFVETVTLNHIARRTCASDETIDLLKMDCEGAEYDALFACSDETLEKIQAIKLEYHKGAVDMLTALFQQNGFHTTKLMRENEQLGNLWVEKPQQNVGTL
jgi:FkbM family methyltransferase